MGERTGNDRAGRIWVFFFFLPLRHLTLLLFIFFSLPPRLHALQGTAGSAHSGAVPLTNDTHYTDDDLSWTLIPIIYIRHRSHRHSTAHIIGGSSFSTIRLFSQVSCIMSVFIQHDGVWELHTLSRRIQGRRRILLDGLWETDSQLMRHIITSFAFWDGGLVVIFLGERDRCFPSLPGMKYLSLRGNLATLGLFTFKLASRIGGIQGIIMVSFRRRR